VYPYIDFNDLPHDRQFIYIWGYLAVVHMHYVNLENIYPHGFSYTSYLASGTGYFVGVHGAEFVILLLNNFCSQPACLSVIIVHSSWRLSLIQFLCVTAFIFLVFKIL
jgi:hypothetical protein